MKAQHEIGKCIILLFNYIMKITPDWVTWWTTLWEKEPPDYPVGGPVAFDPIRFPGTSEKQSGENTRNYLVAETVGNVLPFSLLIIICLLIVMSKEDKFIYSMIKRFLSFYQCFI